MDREQCYWNDGLDNEWHLGDFIGWSTADLRPGPIQPVAIIEDQDDGEIFYVPLSGVRFREPEYKPEKRSP